MGKKIIGSPKDIGTLVNFLHSFMENEDDMVSIELFDDGSFDIRRESESSYKGREIVVSGNNIIELESLMSMDV